MKLSLGDPAVDGLSGTTRGQKKGYLKHWFLPEGLTFRRGGPVSTEYQFPKRERTDPC